MSSVQNIGEFASGVWEEIGSPADPSLVSVSGWMESHIGKLNILIDSTYFTESGNFYPPFGNTEAEIYQALYEVDYFEKQTFKSINGIMDGNTPDWSSIKEGDSSITRSSRSELIKTFRNLKNEAQTEVDKLVGYYNANLSDPIQVVGNDFPIEVSILEAGPKNASSNGFDNPLFATGILTDSGSLSIPDVIDETGDLAYFYFGWENVQNSWLIRRQNRSNSNVLSVNTGYTDLSGAWPNREILNYT